MVWPHFVNGDMPDSKTQTEPEAGQKEIFSSWALFILIMLLILALFASYLLQHKKIQAIHETVISIFAGGTLSAAIGLDEDYPLNMSRDGRWSHHQGH